MIGFLRLFFLLLLFCHSHLLHAQEIENNKSSGSVFGTIMDGQTRKGIEFAVVALRNAKDSSLAGSAITDVNGFFKILDVPVGSHRLKISLVGYVTYVSPLLLLDEKNVDVDMGNIVLIAQSTSLKEVLVVEKLLRTEQKGDTVQMNANAYKTNPDANAEELVTKMPGVTNDNGTVKVNGEEVKKVFVDGKPFFGDDPTMALKNLPAEVIDKIQVYDKASDQAQYTGFDDGQSSKAINIITKTGRNNGTFGKVYAGYGSDEHYIAGANVNLFRGQRRISILGLSNNINQQNFSAQDLLGVTSSGGGQGRGGFNGPGRSGGGGSTGSMQSGGGSGTTNFLVGQQGGISSTHAFGINYTDQLGKKIKIASSYFFNATDNNNNTTLIRDYITSNALYYVQVGLTENNGLNHRFNLQLEYTIDSANSLVYTPRFSFQKSDLFSSTQGSSNLRKENLIESASVYSNSFLSLGYSWNNNLLYRHRFKKKGRTFSLNFGVDLNEKTGYGSLYSRNEFYVVSDTIQIDQQNNSYIRGNVYSAGLIYTEPLDSVSQLMYNYNPSFAINTTEKRTLNRDIVSNTYSLLDALLTNYFDNNYLTHRVGMSYRRNVKKYTFMTGVNFQYADLSGNQYVPTPLKVHRVFRTVLPQAMFNYKFSKGKNWRIYYRTSTNAPAVSQLQQVINNSNPLLLSMGNSQLKQTVEHNISSRYGATNAEKASGLFFFGNINYVQDYIGNSTLIPINDTLLPEGILLNRGVQLTKPVNIHGNWSGRAFATYAFPLTKLKSNLNVNAGFVYNKTPGLINTAKNYANNYTVSQGWVVSSNVSEKIDFSFSYTCNYSIVHNSLLQNADYNYFNHLLGVKFNWLFANGFLLNTNVSQSLYNGLSQNYNQQFLLWNAAFGYKFLKNRSLELKITAFDILAQNNSINRSVTETYIEDSRTQVLTRYLMLMLTYNLSAFQPTADASRKDKAVN